MLPLKHAVNIVTVVSTSTCVLFQQPSCQHHRRNEPRGQRTDSLPMEQRQLEQWPVSQTFCPHLATATATATVAYNADDVHVDNVPISCQQMMSAVPNQLASSILPTTGERQKVTPVPVVQSAPSSLGPPDFHLPSAMTTSSTPTGIPQESDSSTGYAVSYGGSTADYENGRYFTPGLLVGVASTLGYDQSGNNIVNVFDDVSISTDNDRQEAEGCGQSSCTDASSVFEEAFYSSGHSGWREFDCYSYGGGEIGQYGYKELSGETRQCEYIEGMRQSEYNLMSNTDTSPGPLPTFQNCTVSENSAESFRPNPLFLSFSDQKSGDVSAYGTQQNKGNTIHTSRPINQGSGHDSMWYESDIDQPGQQQLYFQHTTFQNDGSEREEVRDLRSTTLRANGEQNGELRSHNGQFIATRQDVTQGVGKPIACAEHEHFRGSKQSRTPNPDGFHQGDSSGECCLYSSPPPSTSSAAPPGNAQLPYQQKQQRHVRHCCQPQSLAPVRHDPHRHVSATASDSQPGLEENDQNFPQHQTPLVSPPFSQSLHPSRQLVYQSSQGEPKPSPLEESSTQNMVPSPFTSLSAAFQSDPCQNHPPQFTPTKSDAAASAENSGREANLLSQDDSSSSPSSSGASLVDVDHLLSSGVTVAGFKPRPIIRKRRKVS